MKHKLIAALEKLVVEADFKTAKTKFLKDIETNYTGFRNPESFIDELFKKFKEVKNKNKIKEIKERNIDFWTKLPFHRFADFVNNLYEKPTSTELKKAPWKQDVSDAEKIAENSDWIVFHITSHEAAKKLGTNNWCIVRDEDYWDEYHDGGENSNPEYPNNFYFALAKKRSYKVLDSSDKDNSIKYADNFHRVAIQVSPHEINYWDADDDVSRIPPENFPPLQGKLEYPNMCRDCKRREDVCDCCTCGCGYAADDCHGCSICNGDATDCDCCTNCNNTGDNCNCCSECNATDRDKCGCWCSGCSELVGNCECDRCDVCKKLEDDCTCVDEDEKEDEDEEEDEDEKEED